MELILASNNPKKLKELQNILMEMGIQVLSQQEAGCCFVVEENGKTFAENARLKALAVTEATGKAAIADDSGLCVDALDGRPGIYSARYGPSDGTDEDRYHFLLKELKGRTNRSARFVSSICCTFPNGDVLTAEGICEGSILETPRGSGGFGYDPVFQVENTGRSMAEFSSEEKNVFSHRGRALRNFQRVLEDYLNEKT